MVIQLLYTVMQLMQIKYCSLCNCKKNRESAAFGLHLVLSLYPGMAAVRCSFVWPFFICWCFTLDFRQHLFWGLCVQLWCLRGMWSFLITLEFCNELFGHCFRES